MSTVAIIGAQWGDEGKGKVVDSLAGRADMVVRFQGGNNAGHTLVVNGHKTVVHLVPSGVLQPNAVNAIGQGLVVDPRVLLDELGELKSQGALQDPGQLRVSNRAAAILPYHTRIDHLREARLGKTNMIGTTGRGIGPAYEDVAARRAVRMGDLLDGALLEGRLERVMDERNALIQWLGGDAVDQSALIDEYLGYGERLRPYIDDTGRLIRAHLAKGSRVLFEGAQGVLLDVAHGTYPFVTSSHTVSGAIATGAAVPPSALETIVGVAKAYTTRVGSGPFPTELHDETSKRIREAGGEYGATTGRPRRCGWLDLPGLRYAHALCGFTDLVMTKLDVLTGLDHVKVCVRYELDGDSLDELPIDAARMSRAKPIYETLPGWDQELGDAREPADLPTAAQDYVRFVEQALDVPIALIGVGPGRTETVSAKGSLW